MTMSIKSVAQILSELLPLAINIIASTSWFVSPFITKELVVKYKQSITIRKERSN